MKSVLITTILTIFVSVCGVATTSAQRCEMRATGRTAESDEPVTGIRAWTINQRTKKKYFSVAEAGENSFGKLSAGPYKVYVTKAGYKTSVLAATLNCSDGAVTLFVRMWQGSSSRFVVIPPVKEMRLDRITMLGNTDIDTGARVDPGTSVVPTGPRSGMPKTVPGGVLNGKAMTLPKPGYPPAARAVHAGGSVGVQVLIGEDGNVISATAVSGHPLLRAASESAARGARFSPTLLSGQPVKVSGIITYNFVP